MRREQPAAKLSRDSYSVSFCAVAPRAVLDVHLRGSGACVSDNQWGPPGQYPQQPSQQPQPGGQGPYQPGPYPQAGQGGYPQGPPPQAGYPQAPPQVPPPGPFAPQPWQQQQPQYGGGMPPGPGQQLPHGLGWGGGPGGSQPPKKGGAGKVILLVLGGLVGAMILLSVVSGYLKHNSSASDSPYYTPTTDPSYSPTYDPTSYESPSTGPSEPTTAPTTQPTTTKPTVTRPTAPRTSTTPPVKRGPTDYEIVSRNKLYSSGAMASVGCKESRARQSTAAGATANYVQLRACLSRFWSPYVKRAGGTFRVPNLQTFTGTVMSPCGSMSDTGPPFYCGDNDTIYMNLTQDVGNYNRYTQSYSKVWARMWMLHQFAHEFGHHVQNMTGILQANHDLRYDAPNRTAELEMTRRLELQASCFSDVFIGANKRTYPITGQSFTQWKWLIANTTDYGNDHGDADIHNYWALRGYNSRNPGACNTFIAPSGRVR